MARALVVAFVALLVGCQQAPSRGSAPDSDRSVVELREEGDALAARGEYAAAAIRYQAVLHRDPDDHPLRFRLGSALSHLGRQAEVIEAFLRVVEAGSPDSPEVGVAHNWLISAGVLAQAVTFASSTGDEQGPETSAAASPRPPSGTVTPAGGTIKGRTEARAGIREVILSLAGDDDQNLEIAFSRIMKPGEAFEFGNVPPGKYRLIAEDPDRDSEIWNVPVTVASGQPVVVDLK